jgi:hypothetical protein
LGVVELSEPALLERKIGTLATEPAGFSLPASGR